MMPTTRADKGHSTGRTTRDAAAWLGLAASPTFALFACIATADAQRMTLCSSASGVVPIDGMVLMYLLMSLFHLPPWLTIAARVRRQIHDPTTLAEGD